MYMYIHTIDNHTIKHESLSLVVGEAVVHVYKGIFKPAVTKIDRLEIPEQLVILVLRDFLVQLDYLVYRCSRATRTAWIARCSVSLKILLSINVT